MSISFLAESLGIVSLHAADELDGLDGSVSLYSLSHAVECALSKRRIVCKTLVVANF